MGRHKLMNASQGNTMEQYTTQVALPQHVARLGVSGDDVRTPLNIKEPSHADLLAVIQGFWVALSGKIEMVAVDVNLLQADLRKVSDKVKVAEGSIVELQTERHLAVLPIGLLERKARTGDRMALVGWRTLITEWRYSKMEQWHWWLLNQ
ncbi:hypothetical protein NDU88_001438 [Pleurodeles waltl]|uniref:Uncharacterized protein n=1 Tax=Pleurodeles waltl TaxID=8319 RepID=A0AAV7V9P7_PLEWA|nr:hypothetical protein NDU88_001438 [Pleurodeles waltl]